MFKLTPTLLCDFYKISHRVQYPENTTLVYSNFTPRNGKYYKGLGKKIKVFGIQYVVKNIHDIFQESFFNRPLNEVLAEYSRVIKYSLGIEYPDTLHLEQLHNLGYLPLCIKALPEGAMVNYGIPILTIRNTLPDYFWLVNFLETWISSDLWMLCNNATLAYDYKVLCEEYAFKTCDNNEHIPFQCHDFSFRGMGGKECAMLSGMAHLSEFKGTDTIPAIQAMEYYYGKNIENELVGTSIPASEHSVMCAGGKDTELETYRRFITELYPSGLVSIVSDTWDLWAVLTDILPQLKDKIMARDGKVVVRPDSGDPVDIICGSLSYAYEYTDKYSFDEFIKSAGDWIVDYVREDTPHGECGVDDCTLRFKYKEKYFDITVDNISWNRYDKQYYFIDMWDKPNITWVEIEVLPEHKGTIQLLWDLFSGTINEKGYKVLDSHIGLIYGDSITHERAQEIFKRLEAKGFASSNVVFGVGSYTYQYNTRDSQGWAMKATYCEIDGKGVEIFKEPKTDLGKKSAKGLLRVERHGDDYLLLDQQNWDSEAGGELNNIFVGEIINDK